MTEPEQDRTPQEHDLKPRGGGPPERDLRARDERRPWLRCYRCWSQNLEAQVHYDAILRIDPESGGFSERVDEVQEAVVQCLDCMHDQPHLTFTDGRSSRSRTAGSGW